MEWTVHQLYREARRQYAAGHLDHSSETCRRLLEISPEHRNGHLLLARVRQKQGDIHVAETEYRAALDIDAASIAGHFGLAGALSRQGRLDESEGEYRKVVLLDPTHWRAQLGLAVAHARRGENDAAMAAYRKVTALNPECAAGRRGLAAILFRESRFEEAEREYRELVAVDPEDAGSRGRLGNLLLQRGALAVALIELKTAVNGGDKFALGRLAMVLHADGILKRSSDLLEQARHAYARAVAARPDDAITVYGLSLLEWQLGNRPEAAVGMRHAMELDASIRESPIFASWLHRWGHRKLSWRVCFQELTLGRAARWTRGVSTRAVEAGLHEALERGER